MKQKILNTIIEVLHSPYLEVFLDEFYACNPTLRHRTLMHIEMVNSTFSVAKVLLGGKKATTLILTRLALFLKTLFLNNALIVPKKYQEWFQK